METRKQSGERPSSVRRLLLVEDDRMMARAVSKALGRADYEVELVQSVAAGRALTAVTFGVGVFDIDLPDGSGVDLARELLASGIVQKVLFFSASMDPDVCLEAQRLGQLINKLDGVAVLLQALDKAVGPAAARRTEARKVAVQMAAVRSDKK